MRYSIVLLSLAAVLLASQCQAITLTRLTPARQWQKLEFRISGVPIATNPFDPVQITLDATFTAPSGVQTTVPAFWFQDYTRSIQDGSESLTLTGNPEWRLRFCPSETGKYQISVAMTLNGQPHGSPFRSTVIVAAGGGSVKGYVKLGASGSYFSTNQGDPLPLNGADVCWYDAAGTYDYDQWFGKMHTAGENFTRIWMCPWAFGIEDFADSLTNYHQDGAWRLDYLLALAEKQGIYITLCLDYHGMFATVPDYWGGNNYWPENPYNTANGGPCATQDDFFTMPIAQAIYEKRLRYLIARYGYSTHLMAWEFFNEIDNDYSYLNATDVAKWHATVGQWLHAADPYGHLVTTSLTGGSNRSEIWSLPELDFVNYHSYGLPHPTLQLSDIVQNLVTSYAKPALVEEFGADWQGWDRSTADPYLRGFRQGLWSGALGGAAGTAMSWWWENIDAENDYTYYQAITKILGPTAWGQGAWQPISFQSADETKALGDPISGGKPFTATLVPDPDWAATVPGFLAVTTPDRAVLSPLRFDSYVQGSYHPDLRMPFQIGAWLGKKAQLQIHIASAAYSPVLEVLVDGTQIYSQQLNQTTNYNLLVTVPLPQGKHVVEIYNGGDDWFDVDRATMVNVLPARFATGWIETPVAIGLDSGNSGLVYVVNPLIDYPFNALTSKVTPVTGGGVFLQNWPAGNFQATWFNTINGKQIGTTSGTTVNGTLSLPIPSFMEDLVGRITAD